MGGAVPFSRTSVLDRVRNLILIPYIGAAGAPETRAQSFKRRCAMPGTHIVSDCRRTLFRAENRGIDFDVIDRLRMHLIKL